MIKVTNLVLAQKIDDMKEYNKEKFDKIEKTLLSIQERCMEEDKCVRENTSLIRNHLEEHKTKTEINYKLLGAIVAITSLISSIVFFVIDKTL